MLYWLYSVTVCITVQIHGFWRQGTSRGNHWCTCVADGDPWFLDHHVTSICSSSVRPEDVWGTCWMSGQPCLLSSGAMATQQEAWTTSLRGSSVAIVFTKFTSKTSRARKSKYFWRKCKKRSQS